MSSRLAMETPHPGSDLSGARGPAQAGATKVQWKAGMQLDQAIGIVGWSGVGKTTLIERLIPVLAEEGLRVSTVKHCHHALALDTRGKDSQRHQQAGAIQTMLVSPAGMVLVQPTRAVQPPLEQMLSAMAEVDLVLVEGFRDYRFRRLEVWDASADRPPRALQDRAIAALVSDCPIPGMFDRPVFRRDDIASIAAFLVMLVSSSQPSASGGQCQQGDRQPIAAAIRSDAGLSPAFENKRRVR